MSVRPVAFAAPIVVTGARGQLGSHLTALLGSGARPVDVDTLDLTQADAVRRQLAEWRPGAIINCAAYTAVDAAEEPANTPICHAVNHAAVSTLAAVAQEFACPLVQISTDYVFCQAAALGRPFREDDPIAPAGEYAISKARGEDAALSCTQAIVVRTCGLYGSPALPEAKNFVNAMLSLAQRHQELRVVNDQICCPTWIAELSAAVLHLLHINARGVFHVTNREGLAWSELAETIFACANVPCRVKPITTAEYGAKAPRPAYSALDTSKYDALGGPRLSTCRDAVRQWLGR